MYGSASDTIIIPLLEPIPRESVTPPEPSTYFVDTSLMASTSQSPQKDVVPRRPLRPCHEHCFGRFQSDERFSNRILPPNVGSRKLVQTTRLKSNAVQNQCNLRLGSAEAADCVLAFASLGDHLISSQLSFKRRYRDTADYPALLNFTDQLLYGRSHPNAAIKLAFPNRRNRKLRIKKRLGLKSRRQPHPIGNNLEKRKSSESEAKTHLFNQPLQCLACDRKSPKSELSNNKSPPVAACNHRDRFVIDVPNNATQTNDSPRRPVSSQGFNLDKNRPECNLSNYLNGIHPSLMQTTMAIKNTRPIFPSGRSSLYRDYQVSLANMLQSQSTPITQGTVVEKKNPMHLVSTPGSVSQSLVDLEPHFKNGELLTSTSFSQLYRRVFMELVSSNVIAAHKQSFGGGTWNPRHHHGELKSQISIENGKDDGSSVASKDRLQVTRFKHGGQECGQMTPICNRNLRTVGGTHASSLIQSVNSATDTERARPDSAILDADSFQKIFFSESEMWTTYPGNCPHCYCLEPHFQSAEASHANQAKRDAHAERYCRSEQCRNVCEDNKYDPCILKKPKNAVKCKKGVVSADREFHGFRQSRSEGDCCKIRMRRRKNVKTKTESKSEFGSNPLIGDHITDFKQNIAGIGHATSLHVRGNKGHLNCNKKKHTLQGTEKGVHQCQGSLWTHVPGSSPHSCHSVERKAPFPRCARDTIKESAEYFHKAMNGISHCFSFKNPNDANMFYAKPDQKRENSESKFFGQIKEKVFSHPLIPIENCSITENKKLLKACRHAAKKKFDQFTNVHPMLQDRANNCARGKSHVKLKVRQSKKVKRILKRKCNEFLGPLTPPCVDEWLPPLFRKISNVSFENKDNYEGSFCFKKCTSGYDRKNKLPNSTCVQEKMQHWCAPSMSSEMLDNTKGKMPSNEYCSYDGKNKLPISTCVQEKMQHWCAPSMSSEMLDNTKGKLSSNEYCSLKKPSISSSLDNKHNFSISQLTAKRLENTNCLFYLIPAKAVSANEAALGIPLFLSPPVLNGKKLPTQLSVPVGETAVAVDSKPFQPPITPEPKVTLEKLSWSASDTDLKLLSPAYKTVSKANKTTEHCGDCTASNSPPVFGPPKKQFESIFSSLFHVPRLGDSVQEVVESRRNSPPISQTPEECFENSKGIGCCIPLKLRKKSTHFVKQFDSPATFVSQSHQYYQDRTTRILAEKSIAQWKQNASPNKYCYCRYLPPSSTIANLGVSKIDTAHNCNTPPLDQGSRATVVRDSPKIRRRLHKFTSASSMSISPKYKQSEKSGDYAARPSISPHKALGLPLRCRKKEGVKQATEVLHKPDCLADARNSGESSKIPGKTISNESLASHLEQSAISLFRSNSECWLPSKLETDKKSPYDPLRFNHLINHGRHCKKFHRAVDPDFNEEESCKEGKSERSDECAVGSGLRPVRIIFKPDNYSNFMGDLGTIFLPNRPHENHSTCFSLNNCRSHHNDDLRKNFSRFDKSSEETFSEHDDNNDKEDDSKTSHCHKSPPIASAFTRNHYLPQSGQHPSEITERCSDFHKNVGLSETTVNSLRSDRVLPEHTERNDPPQVRPIPGAWHLLKKPRQPLTPACTNTVNKRVAKDEDSTDDHLKTLTEEDSESISSENHSKSSALKLAKSDASQKRFKCESPSRLQFLCSKEEENK